MARYKRITRRETVKGPDEFLGFWDKTFHWAAERKETLLKGGAAVVAAAILAAGIVTYNQGKEAEASRELFRILRDNPDGQAVDTTKTAAELAAFEEKYGRTNAGRQGLLYRANMLSRDKKSDEAVKAYQQVIGNGKDIVSQLGALGLAAQYQTDGKFLDAIATLGKFRDDSYFAEEMDYMVAHNLELAGNKAEALKEYRKFLEKYPLSSNTAKVKEGLARAS